MPGNVTFTPFAISPALQAIDTGVFLYDATARRYSALAQVVWSSITVGRGPVPSTGTFRYRHTQAPEPVRFEDVLPLVPPRSVGRNPAVLRPDDRIVVLAMSASGKPVPLFDGFVTTPEVQVAGKEAYDLGFTAVGVPIRLFDAPIRGSHCRHFDKAKDAEDSDRIETDVPARFNPGGRPNATGDPYDDHAIDATSKVGSFRFPLFLDAEAQFDPVRDEDDYRRLWDLGMAARYILATMNDDEKWVKNPVDFHALDKVLEGRFPKGSVFDPSDPLKYTRAPLRVRDLIISGMPWPEALWQLLEPHGFCMCFDLEADADGLPVHRLRLYRERDGAGLPLKNLLLQPAGTQVDPGRSNARAFALARDYSRVRNAVAVDGAQEEFEVGIVLAPGFRFTTADSAEGNLNKWLSTNPDVSIDKDKFRLFVGDESGEGHWRIESDDADASYLGQWVRGEALDLRPVFGLTRPYAHERRPPLAQLITKDAAGNPRPWELAILTDYNGPAPGVWDRSGTVRPIKGGFRLLTDRIGVRVTAQNPDATFAGDMLDSTQHNGGALRLVKWLAAGQRSERRKFALLLTVVVRADSALVSAIGRRATNPTKFEVRRRVDARDRYKRRIVHPSSYWSTQEAPVTARDDEPKAFDYARALRDNGETAPFGGPIEIGRLVHNYRVGDRIAGFAGRDVSFQINAAVAGSGEAPRYPAIVGLIWTNDAGGQRTSLQLSDYRGADPEPN